MSFLLEREDIIFKIASIFTNFHINKKSSGPPKFHSCYATVTVHVYAKFVDDIFSLWLNLID